MRTTLTFITLLLIFATAFGQEKEHRQDKKEQIAAQKVAFITNKMQLTPDEAKVFWPVYDQYERELAVFRNEQRERHKANGGNLESMSDAEVEEMIDAHIEIKEQELEVKKHYHEQLKKLVGPRKVAMLYKAEKDFHRILLQRYKQGKQGAEMKRQKEQGSP